MMGRSGCAASALLAVSLALHGLLAAAGVAEAETAAQTLTCIQDRELRLHNDKTVYACRIAEAATLSVGPEAKNHKVVCAARSYVEFHYNGHLSYCDHLAKSGAYLTSGGESRQCKGQGPISFDQSGYLEYCS